MYQGFKNVFKNYIRRTNYQMHMYVDVHAHLLHPLFDSKRDELLKQAKENNISAIIENGLNPESNRQVLKFAQQHSLIKAAIGYYPTDALGYIHTQEGLKKDPTFKGIDEELEFIKKNKNKIVAIGEVGMDFYWIKDENKQQIENFEKILTLAETIQKPIIVHSRKAEQEILDLIESSNVKKVNMHAFGGNMQLVKRAVKRGIHFSINANIQKSSHTQALVQHVPLSLMLTETDSPYLGPNKDEINTPLSVLHTIPEIAKIKGMDPLEVKNIIYNNYQKLFS